MNKQDQRTLEVINGEMKRRKLKARFRAHHNYPLRHFLFCEIDEKRLVRVDLGFREVTYFLFDGPDTCFGTSISFGGPFKGQGWRERLAGAAANAFEAYS